MFARRGFLVLAGILFSRRAMSAAGPDRTLVKGELDGFTQGPWTAFIAPFNKGSLVKGVEYDQSVTIDPANFPNKTLFTCRFPESRTKLGIYGYNSVQFGNYYNTIPARPIPSSQIRDIKALIVKFDLQLKLGAKNSNANVQIDGFLTSTKNPNDIVAEYQIFLHTPDFTKDYANTLRSLGTFISQANADTPQIVWNVYREPKNAQNSPDYIFYPANTADVLSGTFDMKQVFDWLSAPNPKTGATYLGGSEYFNGTSVGLEPIHGEVELLVKSIGCEYR